MFDSGISLKELVSDLKQEVDIAVSIPNSNYLIWANALEQLLYTEIVKEQAEVVIENPTDFSIDLAALDIPSDENAIRFEDIYTVFADDVQLIKTNLTSGNIFPNTFCKASNLLACNIKNEPQCIKIIYFVKPALKVLDDSGNIGSGNVMLPIEFIDLMKAKLRGEAYKIANEDELGAKWLNDYNILLETFKTWLDSKQSTFGM